MEVPKRAVAQGNDILWNSQAQGTRRASSTHVRERHRQDYGYAGGPIRAGLIRTLMGYPGPPGAGTLTEQCVQYP